MKRPVMACTLILGGLLALPLRAADHGPGGWGSGGGRGHEFGGPMLGFLHNERMRTELGITDEQAGKLRQIFTDSRKASIRNRAELQIRRMELHEIMMGDNANREAALKKVQEISDLRAQQMRTHVESMLAAKTVLTPEQQKKIHAMMADRMAHRGGGFRGRRGFGRGSGGPDGPGEPRGGFGGPDGPPRELAPELDEE